MSKISVQEVLKLARLSKIELTEEEAEKYAKEIESILGYVEQLQSVDTGNLEPTSQVTGLTNVSRDDKQVDYQAKPEDLIKGTPETQDRYIKVKRVL